MRILHRLNVCTTLKSWKYNVGPGNNARHCTQSIVCSQPPSIPYSLLPWVHWGLLRRELHWVWVLGRGCREGSPTVNGTLITAAFHKLVTLHVCTHLDLAGFEKGKDNLFPLWFVTLTKYIWTLSIVCSAKGLFEKGNYEAWHLTDNLLHTHRWWCMCIVTTQKFLIIIMQHVEEAASKHSCTVPWHLACLPLLLQQCVS